MNQTDPDSLTTILGLSLDEKSDWEEPLQIFTQFLKYIRTNNPPLLPAPYSDLTDNFLYVSTPNILKKCLLYADCRNQSDLIIVEFLKEVISTASFSVTNKNTTQLIPVVCQIFDPVHAFYLHNGRIMNQQYSMHMTTLANYAIQNYIPFHLLQSFSNEDFKIEDFEASITLFHRIIFLTGNNNIFSDQESTSSIFCDTLSRFSMDTEDRKIPYKKLIGIITSITSFFKSEDLTTTLINIMMHFMDIDIIDIKLAGIKICITVYTTVLPTETILEEYYQGTFAYVIGQASSNIESLVLLKPVLIKFAENNALVGDILDCLWNGINSLAPSVIQRGFDLFAEIALKVKTVDNHLIELILNPPNIDILCRLVNGPNFSQLAINELSTLAEKESSIEALDALIKVSLKTNLVNMIPEILSNINNKQLLLKNIVLINRIIIKTPTIIDTKEIVSSLSHNFSMYSIKEVEEVMESLSSILMRTRTKVTNDDFSILIKNCTNNESLTIVIKSLLTNNAVLIELENNKVFKELIERASFDFSLFEIARHIYLLFNENHDLPNCETIKQITFNALWNSLLKAENNEQRISISDLLLTFNDNRKLPDCIYNYVQTCLDFLLNNPISQNINNSTIYNECRNAALFINECIETSSKFVSLEHFGLKSHRFIVPESIINVSIEADGEKYEISVNQNANVAYLITVISSKLNRDVTSIILYSKGKSVPVQTKLASTDLNFEVRFRAEYDRVPPFTLENHPISLLTNEKYMNHLLELLNSPIGEDIYNILIQIPTPKQFKATDLDPSNSYLFLYTLHYYAQHIDELPNKNEQQKNFEDIICQKFDIIVPEARYLLVLLLDKETKNDLLVTKVLYTLCIEKNPQYFTRIMRKLWEIVSNYEISLDPKILSPIIFKDNAKFRELALKSHLIKSQEFDKVWKIFLSNEEKLNHLKVFTMFEIPPNRYQEVFDTLLPFFDSLDESILAIFANLSEKWSNFPADKIANVLITSYIKCTTKPQSISSNPFKLIMSIIQNNEKMREYILSALNQTIPETTEWNYTPTDSFKCNEKCGLNNLGATCYVNSVLQQIFNIEPLRNFIISNDEFIDPSMQALHKLFTQMMYSQRKFIDMNIFATQWTGWDGACINPREQQDANEFLMCLFSRLEMYPEIYSLINGETETRFVGEGKTISTQKTSFNTLPLIVLGQNSIKDSMKIAAIPEIIENYKVDDNSKPITVESTNKIITLPPYLFFQLKRFDYSIETQTRVKIDQKYEYEDEIDLKEFVEFSGETKYRIIGVILHQGEVDVGHYFSYTKINENQWRCLNDTGVTIVSDNVMKNETYGNPEGSSAYILVYERIDVHSPPDTASNDASGSIVSSISSQIPLSPNPELVDEVQKDNLRLIVDSVYFTEYFADFIFQLMNTTNNNEEVDSIALKYSMSSLVHSSLADSYSKFVSSFSQKFHESENFMNIFTEYIQDNLKIIIDVMTECTNKSIKLKFADLIVESFKNMPTDCVLLIVIVSQMSDWYPIILKNWRNGFDFFKIFADFAAIDEEHLNFFNELDIIPGVLSFVQDSIQPFVSDKENKSSAERFKRLCDMTSIFKLFEATKTPLSELTKPSFFKWCINSEKHPAALLKLLSTDESTFSKLDKLVDACGSGTKLSEYFISEIVLNYVFKIPNSWLHKYISQGSEQKHVLRALSDQITDNYSLFATFANSQSQLLCHLMFSSDKEVREDFISLVKKVESKGDVASILFPFVERIFGLSKFLYNSKPEYAKKNASPELFHGLQFLTYLSEIAPKLPNLFDYLPIVEKTLYDIVEEVRLKRDEHAILLATIGLTMMRNAPQISSEFVCDIEYVITNMMCSDHKNLDNCLRGLCLGLIEQYEISNIKTEFLVPDIQLSSFIFKGALSKDIKPLKRPAIDLLKCYGKRYGTASRALKLVYGVMDKIVNLDIPAVYEILNCYSNDVFKSNLQSLFASPKVLAKIVTQYYSIKEDADVLSKMASFLSIIIEKQDLNVRLALTEYEPQVLSLLRFLSDDRSSIQCRTAALSIVKQWIKVTHGDIYQPSDTILKHFQITHNKYQEENLDEEKSSEVSDELAKVVNDEIDSFSECLIEVQESHKIQSCLSNELAASFENTTESSLRIKTLKKLCEIIVNEPLARNILESKLLQKVWALQPSENASFEGAFTLTKSVLPFMSPYELNEIKELASKFAEADSFHKEIGNLQNSP